MKHLSLLLLLATTAAQAQVAGSNDDAFNVGDVGNGQGQGPYILTTRCVAVMPDDKVIVGGGFRYYNAVQSRNIARTLPNGLRDTSFHVALSMNGELLTLAPQADGSVLAGGSFTASEAGLIRTGILRLTPGGAIDPAFDEGSGFDELVRRIAVQPDGRILVGGEFTTYNGTPRAYLARLEADGSLDPSFDPGTLFNGSVRAIAVQPDGKILVGGAFTAIGAKRIVRLNTDGTQDLTFTGPAGTSQQGEVRAIALQPDGKVLIAGSFTQNNPDMDGIGRVNADGSVDATFDVGTGFDGPANDLLLQPDGRVVAVGDFTDYNGAPTGNVARLLSDGALDPTFQSGRGFTSDVLGVARQSDGALLFVGSTAYDRLRCPDLMRTTPNGARDHAFNPVSGFETQPTCVAVQGDGKILVGGAQIFNGVVRRGLVRLQPNGDLDPAFDPGDGPAWGSPSWGNVNALLPLADSRVLVGGQFTLFDSVPQPNLVRLLADGEVDNTFITGTGPSGGVERMVLQPDGRILLMGYFASYNGVPRYRIARIEADGALDAGFDATNAFTSSTGTVLLNAMALQPDGKILIGGFFNSVQGLPRMNIARLNTDGTLDTSFDADSLFNDLLLDIALQPDGRILCSGFFEDVDGMDQNRIARLMPDGAFDPSFAPDCGFCGLPAEPAALIVQPDGRILVSGAFYTVSGTSGEGIARFLPDGTIDPDFVSDGFSTNLYEASNASFVPAMAMQADGKVICAGRFASYNDVGRNGIARIFAYDISTAQTALVAKPEYPLIYPVPNDGRTLWWEDPGIAPGTPLRVLDAQGRQVHAGRTSAADHGQLRIDFPKLLRAGSYMLILTGKDTLPLTRTFIVE